MSIVVNWVTSPCKSVVLLQLLINFFPLKEIKSASIVEGEATPTRSVPLPVEEKEEESEEAREGGIVVVARGVYMVAMLTTSPEIFIQNIKMELTVSHSCYRCHCSR